MASENTGLNIPAASLEKLVQAHDGDLALLFLYLLKGGAPDLDSAALALCRTGAEIKSALEKLERMDLLPSSLPAVPRSSESVSVPLPADAMPEYTIEDISSRTRSDSIWAAVKSKAENVTGHILSSSDIRILYGAYDYLELNGEVLMLLLHFLGEVYEEKYSGSKKPGAKAIETEAFRWHNAGVDSFEAAEAYITDRKERAALSGKIKGILQIRGRNLSATETKYIEGWISMGMAEDAIELAYDRTVVNKGQLIWPYMNKILQSWNEKGLHSADEISRALEAGGRNASSRDKSSASAIALQSEEELQRLIKSI